MPLAADNAHDAADALTELPTCACVILTSHGRPGYLRNALAAWVRGFLPKTVSAQILTSVIQTVAGGGRYVDPRLALTPSAVAPHY